MTRITSKVYPIYDVLYSGRFQVPWHQRHYDWSRQEVDDLLRDLQQAVDADKTCYFLGSIMLLEGDEGEPQRINDGQQRLITFSLLMAALCSRFADEGSDSVRESLGLRTVFVRPVNLPSSLADADHYTPRIIPPRSDKGRYYEVIRGRRIGSNGLMTTAWNKITRFVTQMDTPTAKRFFDFLMDNVEISVLTVPPDVDANLVFETLNARGRPLDQVDLIRNLLYSCFSDATKVTLLEAVHTSLERTLVLLPNKWRVSDYFRCYLQCQYGFLQKTRFHREFRVKLERESTLGDLSERAHTLVAGLGSTDSLRLFLDIISGKPDHLEERLPKVSGKRTLAVLLDELKTYSVSHPLCFALLHRFVNTSDGPEKRVAEKAVARSLRNLASYIMRAVFVTSTFQPSRIDAALANCAHEVFTSTDITSLDIMDCLRAHDPFAVVDDAGFVRRMTDVEFQSDQRASNQKALRYLFGINAQEQKGSDALKIGGCSVEHVLPQSEKHWSGWPEFTNPAEWRYRAGNLVVLSRNENQGGDFNASFEAKERTLSRSTIQMARDVADRYDRWNPDIVQKRSQNLARAAARIWKFS